jgi:hypothetical protein
LSRFLSTNIGFSGELQKFDWFGWKSGKRGIEVAVITPNILICGKTDTCVTFRPLSVCNGIINIILNVVPDALGVSLAYEMDHRMFLIGGLEYETQ